MPNAVILDPIHVGRGKETAVVSFEQGKGWKVVLVAQQPEQSSPEPRSATWEAMSPLKSHDFERLEHWLDSIYPGFSNSFRDEIQKALYELVGRVSVALDRSPI